MTDGPHLQEAGRAPRVPRVPAARRRAALAATGVLVALLCGLCAASSRAALEGRAGWTAAVAALAGLLAALSLRSRVRRDVAGRLRLEGTVLVGRTLLGDHGVDLARVTAASAGSDPELGGLVAVRLDDGERDLVAPWSRLDGLPEARRLLVDRHRRGALLPAAVCDAWDLPAPPQVPAPGPVRRDGVERAIGGLTLIGSAAAVAAGVLLA
ncbi:hypothetical protein ACI79J_14320 [Geodermatophilus sp. SYSU D01062]